ncbi:MAG: hypothetical protein WCL32_05615 [Planctomycetota bacterium]|jgi:hypothetical protein
MPDLDALQTTFKTKGPAAMIDRLLADLKAAKDYQSLFYALLMKKRHELGVSPIATGNNNDIPADKVDAFENGIRDASRSIGQLYLAENNLPQAWAYFRMIGETEPIKNALENVTLAPDEDPQPLIGIAFYEGVLPTKGFDWILSRYGTCNAITTVSSSEMPFPPEVKQYCVRRLIQTLHNDLIERLSAEIERKQGFPPTAKTVEELIQGRDWLFEEESYHIDLSHLNSVIQMAAQLDTVVDLRRARDLCKYGQKLSTRYGFQTDPPFENTYVDYDIFLAILCGDDVEKNLDHFRKKAADADPETVGLYPAEVLVNLLLKIGRPAEALEISRKYLTKNAEGRRTCPSFVELCQQTKNFTALADSAREQGNPINFTAALLANGNG